MDDSVPIDAQGRVLLPRTSIVNEAWSLIIAKVACRIASQTYEQAIGKGDFGDANVLQMFTGWIRVPYSLSRYYTEKGREYQYISQFTHAI